MPAYPDLQRINFSDENPGPPEGGVNIRWQNAPLPASASTPQDFSAHLKLSDMPRQGNGALFQMAAAGAKTSGHVLLYDADGNAIDGGAPAILDGGGAKTEGAPLLFDASGKAIAGAAARLVPALPNDATKFLNGLGSWSTPAAGGGGGTGDVVGPSSAVDGHLAVFDGATGKLIKDGGPVPAPGGGGGGGWQTLTDGANIAWDLSSGNGVVTLGGNRTLDNPTNMVAGTVYALKILQDATGGRTLSFGPAYKLSSTTLPSLSSGANAADCISFLCDGVSMMQLTFVKDLFQASILPPFSIPGCKLWLRPDSLTSAEGKLITLWPDSSGNASDAAITAPAAPIYRASLLNGRPALSFGGGKGMASLAVFNGAYSIMAVYRLTTGGNPSGAQRCISGSNNFLIGPYAGNHRLYNGTWIVGPEIVMNGWVKALATFNGVDTSYLYVNDVRYGPSGTGAPGTLCLGAAGSYAESLNGDLAEVIAYDRDLAADERSALSAYISAKYGL